MNKRGRKLLVRRRRKSSRADKIEGAKDKTKGRAEEALGTLIGNKILKAKGRLDQMKGTAKEKKGELKKLFE